VSGKEKGEERKRKKGKERRKIEKNELSIV
jgi:hypothetical protein